jgi:hypothetical protein
MLNKEYSGPVHLKFLPVCEYLWLHYISRYGGAGIGEGNLGGWRTEGGGWRMEGGGRRV